MTLCFTADLHLADTEPRKSEQFLSLLEHAPQYEHLYILGDLFEFWLGDDVILPIQRRVMDALSDAVSRGATISIQRGNRDFLLGDHFAQQTGVHLIDDPFILERHGRRLLLMHGDLLCQDDRDYQQLRTTLRNPQWIAEFLDRPIETRIEIAQGLRSQSRQQTGKKSTQVMDVSPSAVVDYLIRHHAYCLIHGHIHHQGLHTLSLPNGEQAERWVLGEWGVNGGPLIIEEDGVLRFSVWPSTNI